MKKVAIIRCLHSNDVCTGAACLRALANHTGEFSRYGEDKLEIVAFCSCNGCGKVQFDNDKGIEEKLATIVMLKPDAVHLGVCTQIKNASGKRELCDQIKIMVKTLTAQGIKIVEGTH